MATVLDWTAQGGVGPKAPCVLCEVPTILRSPQDVPCHKTCAEAWADEHAVTPEPGYEQRELSEPADHADADEL